MLSCALLDCAGRRGSPATLSGFHRGRPPRNKGLRYPPDPPTVEEIIAVMRIAGNDADCLRLRALIVAGQAEDTPNARCTNPRAR